MPPTGFTEPASTSNTLVSPAYVANPFGAGAPASAFNVAPPPGAAAAQAQAAVAQAMGAAQAAVAQATGLTQATAPAQEGSALTNHNFVAYTSGAYPNRWLPVWPQGAAAPAPGSGPPTPSGQPAAP